MFIPTHCQLRLPGRRAAAFGLGRWLMAGALLAMLPLSASLLRAQDIPPGMIGRIEGRDVSVEGGIAAGNAGATETASIFVANGSAVTVHSGEARLMLLAGGEVDICGPAKFTPLQSGAAITLALNFGRMRIRLRAATELRIFTPTIIATPIGISGDMSDVTLGLSLDDSLCVLAANGAIQLEHQFTGEKLIVPQAGEFFMAAGKLVPVAGATGSCQCAAMLAPPSPIAGLETATHSVPGSAVQPASHATTDAATPEPSIEFSVPAHANELHPLTPPRKNAMSEPPPVSAPVYKVMMPPLEFSASHPVPPPDPSSDAILLVREAQVQPQWQFTGRVAAPLKETARSDRAKNSPSPSAGKLARKRGFWHALKKAFFGDAP